MDQTNISILEHSKSISGKNENSYILNSNPSIITQNDTQIIKAIKVSFFRIMLLFLAGCLLLTGRKATLSTFSLRLYQPLNQEYHGFYPRCDVDGMSNNPHCLIFFLKSRISKSSNVIIVQTNKGFLNMAMNLICSAESNRILYYRYWD